MARASKAAKEINHKKIIGIAARIIKRDGIDGLNLNEVMKSVGLTHGGFYRHFESKGHLVREAIQSAFQKFQNKLEENLKVLTPEEALIRFIENYLSTDHVKNFEEGCPVAAFTAEIPRQNTETKAVFNKGLADLVLVLDHALAGSRKTSAPNANVMVATLAGAVVLARSVDSTEVQNELLTNTKNLLILS